MSLLSDLPGFNVWIVIFPALLLYVQVESFLDYRKNKGRYPRKVEILQILSVEGAIAALFAGYLGMSHVIPDSLAIGSALSIIALTSIVHGLWRRELLQKSLVPAGERTKTKIYQYFSFFMAAWCMMLLMIAFRPD